MNCIGQTDHSASVIKALALVLVNWLAACFFHNFCQHEAVQPLIAGGWAREAKFGRAEAGGLRWAGQGRQAGTSPSDVPARQGFSEQARQHNLIRILPTNAKQCRS